MLMLFESVKGEDIIVVLFCSSVLLGIQSLINYTWSNREKKLSDQARVSTVCPEGCVV